MTPEPARSWACQTFPHDHPLTRCRFSPCGRFVFAAGFDGSVQRWDLESGTKTSIAAHPTWVADLALHGGTGRLFSADYHGTIVCRPYADADPQPLWTVEEAHQGWLRALAVSPDGKTLVSAGNDRTLRVWSAGTGKTIKTLESHKGYVFSLAFHPDGHALASGDLFGVVKEWDLDSGRCVRDLDAGLLHTRKDDFLADVGGVRALAFDAEGTQLACAGMANAQGNTFCQGEPCVLVFDWKTGKPERRLRGNGKVDGYVNTVRFVAGAVLAGSGEGLSGAGLWFWKPDQAEPFHTVPGQSGYDLDLHPDGLRLALALFEPKGRGGNGRHAKRGEYVGNAGCVRVFSMTPQPGKKA